MPALRRVHKRRLAHLVPPVCVLHAGSEQRANNLEEAARGGRRQRLSPHCGGASEQRRRAAERGAQNLWPAHAAQRAGDGSLRERVDRPHRL